MRNAVCLRCDWQGETAATACPNCGTLLYRPAESRHVERTQDPRPTPRREPAGEADDPSYEPVRRSRPLAVLALVLAILVTAGATFFGLFTTSPEPSAELSPAWIPSGALVFVASGGADRVRLWHWDLSTGEVQLGPIVDRPVELVSATSVLAGSVGMTTVGGNGDLRAWFVRFPASTDDPEPLLSGDVVTWAFGGSRVVTARPHATPGCAEGGSQVVSFDIPTAGTGPDLNVCADVPSVARAGFTTFFTRRTSSGSSIRYVGIHRSHQVLPGYTLLAASPTGDLLVLGEDRRDGVALFWQGNRNGPVPYAVGNGPLLMDRVLAWSPDAGHALVLGRVGARLGVWSIRAGASASPEVRTPTLVVRVEEPTWATYAADGTAYVEAGGELLAFRDGALSPITPPAGVPTPAGPLVWVP